MALAEGSTSVILKNVAKLIQQKVAKDTAPLLEQFTNLLYSNISNIDLDNRNESDMYGATLSLWNSLNLHQDSSPVIKVFNPEVTKHGWKSSHTVIEVIVRDMPFLVDSIRIALNRLGLSAHLMLNAPIKIVRDNKNIITQMSAAVDKTIKSTSVETVFFIEIDRQTEQSVLDNITDELRSVVSDISLTVNDWQPMLKRLQTIIGDVKKAKLPCGKIEQNNALEFLQWMENDNFTIMGYRFYNVTELKGDIALEADVSTSLGLMKNSTGTKQRLISTLGESARELALGNNLLILTKTNSRARVHRPAHLDYIGIKRFDKEGNVVGEDRFVGLFGSAFYTNSALDLPLIKSKVAGVCDSSGFAKGTHAYKSLVNILETYPRDEILQTETSQLLTNVLGILRMQERDFTGLFVRRDAFNRFYSCMVYVPRERYNTKLREDTQALLKEAFGSDQDVEFNTFFSESVQARTHYIVRVNKTKADINVKEIEKNLNEAARSWDDKLATTLKEHKGEAVGKKLSRKYVHFPQSYKDEVLPGSAIVDIEKLESLTSENQLEMLFYQPQEEQNTRFVKLKLFHIGQPLHLSDVLPMLENFGLRIIGESPYAVKTSEGERCWILDFSMMLTGNGEFNLAVVQSLFQDAFAKVWGGTLEDDGFNRLILGAELSGREVSILRAFAKYERQIGGTFSQSYIEDTFARYPNLAELLIKLFVTRFDPKGKAADKAITKLLAEIESSLDKVANLDDDRIIRRFSEMISATIRTNYFQKHPVHGEKPYISFKVLPSQISDVPLPVPKFEIFVYSPQIEGVHLRGGKVARGGLRWSDRREDFRTEVLGLVKAQQVKNTVIVPVGAKGGFVCKQLPVGGTRQEIFEAGKECYRTFIRALLDITDNIVGGEIVPPIDVVRYDEDDPYLVVAADKGTATFSDTANAISDEYGFWLGDAFASGGSVGYDHKAMGITAKGAWVAVKRHFREMDIDCQSTDFTCVGIGDMAGDVFGNGMLLSKHIRLQAAFNHMHIFIDPNPDAASSFKERERLFNLPGCSWEDYNVKLISEGGGIFNRTEKSLKLSPQIKKMLGTQKLTMSPVELMQSLLKMKVDLLWNGGIGTYVKSSKQTHLEVGDRANDSLRINGNELQAKVIGEGGNLGFTQLGRIEAAMNGARLNADSVDNVAGVDCSDNEVNIKILLNSLVQNGDLTVKQRNQLLYDMTDEVGALVIEDCYRQTHSLSITAMRGASQLKEQTRFIHELERSGKLDRSLEFIPNDDEIAERLSKGKGLTRPELSVLLAYSKMVLKDDLVTPEITENSFHDRLLINAFPQQLKDSYQTQMQEHPLRAEIIATKLANNMCNDMGFNFVNRMYEETGATVAEIANCYVMASEVFELSNVWQQITLLDNKIPTAIQTELLFQLRRTVRRVTRWFLRHRNKTLNIAQTIAYYQPTFANLSKNLNDYLVKGEVEQLQRVENDLVREGIPKNIAIRISQLSSLFPVMDIADITNESKQSIEFVSGLYFNLGSRLDLHWFLDQITGQPVANHWQALARASFREELDWQQRALALVVLRCNSNLKDISIDGMLNSWIETNEQSLSRWVHILADFRIGQTHEFAMFSVALRELMLLSLNCESIG